MTSSDDLLSLMRDARLAPLAFARTPAWLWNADATRILWANAVGAAMLPTGPFLRSHPAAHEIAQLAPRLPASGNPQLSRLRGIVSGRLLTCACMRLRFADGTAAVLVTSAEAVRPALPLRERVRRLLADTMECFAFDTDGALLHAPAEHRAALGGHETIAALGGETILRDAIATGRAAGSTVAGTLSLERMGSGDDTVLLATLKAPVHVAQAEVAQAVVTQADVAEVDVAQVVEAPVTIENAPRQDDEPVIATQGEDADEPTLVDVATGEPPVPEVAAEDDASGGHTAPVALAAEDDASTLVTEPTGDIDDSHNGETLEDETRVDNVLESALADADENGPAIAPADFVPVDATPAAATIAETVEIAEPGPSLSLPPLAPPALPDTLDAARQRLIERRHPLRFVWTIDADNRFAIEPGDFITLVGEPTTRLLGSAWSEVAGTLGLDPEGRIVRAIASRDTWSGAQVSWPVQGIAERLPVLLSGLPVVARDRAFQGYRGFGVCRDLDRIAAVVAARRAGAVGSAPAQDSSATEPPVFLPADAAAAAPRDARPQLTVVPTSRNVVPLRAGATGDKRPTLNPVERNAFQEIARTLGARAEGEPAAARGAADTPAADGALGGSPPSSPDREEAPLGPAPEPVSVAAAPDGDALAQVVLDRLPAAVLVFRGRDLLIGNRAFLALTGYDSLDALAAAGGVDALFGDPANVDPSDDDKPHALALRGANGATQAVDARLFAVPCGGARAMMLSLTRAEREDRSPQVEVALAAAQAEARELASILDTATDGVVIVDADGRIVSLNTSAEALFGYERADLAGRPMLDLFAPESRRSATDYLEGLTRSGVASLLNDGREVIGRVRQGGLIPLFMTMGRIGEEPQRFCAVLRDITQWKRAEEDLTNAKRQAEKASSAKSDFLAKISHEIRTPLNAIIGFSEVMMQERFGPVGSDRYRGYARDIHTSGEHMISLLNDLLDLSKIEAGKMELAFAKVDLNDVLQQCVAIMQPQANRERIIIRTALSPALPPVVADTRSIRQIVLNLLSNAIKFTGAGGQVIVSTALTDVGEAVLRVRDTGVGMSEKDIATALEPFRQLPTSARLNAVTGTGLGLPLTKALAEANRATFHIKSAPDAGTLVEIIFPPNRVLAE